MKSFKSFVLEKTLTPAEKKKREEVAKAIERDNPDMPMDKKMAIATATAKKVAEATANIADIEKHKRISSSDKEKLAKIHAMMSKERLQRNKKVAEEKKMEGEDPCWDSHEMVGMKTKNGKKVPNCVPK